MSRPGRLIEGFSYLSNCEVAMTAREWQELTRDCLRKTCEGETHYFGPGKDPQRGYLTLAYEVYALIPAATATATQE